MTRGNRPVVGAVVQARMGSERLPGKVLMPLAGASVLDLVLRRTRRARTLDAVVCATTTNAADDAVAAAATALGVAVHRGSEQDVLARYVGAAEAHALDVVVRVTADCPLVDPSVIDLVVAHFLAQPAPVDYASNTWPRSVPIGLDVEAVAAEALRRAARESTAARDREHVTLYVKEHPEAFRISPVRVAEPPFVGRWTVDEPSDLEFVRAVYAALGQRDDVGWGEVVDLLARRPDLVRINAQVRQKAP